MPEMIVIASLPRSFTTTGRPLLVGAAAAQITVAYAGKVGEAATQTLLMQVLENTSNPTSQHRCTPIKTLQISHEHVVVQTGTKTSQQASTPPPLPDILPLFYSVREREEITGFSQLCRSPASGPLMTLLYVICLCQRHVSAANQA